MPRPGTDLILRVTLSENVGGGEIPVRKRHPASRTGGLVVVMTAFAVAGLACRSLVAAEPVAPEPDKLEKRGDADTVPDPAEVSPPAGSEIVSLSLDNGKPGTATTLPGPDARLQLVLTATDAAGRELDRTRAAHYTAEPAGIVRIDGDALVTPLADGVVTVTAESDGRSATVQLEVVGMRNPKPIHFASEVVPIFTKLGCNGGGCHGKIAGQNGFKLSLLGFEPRKDYEYLVRESRGRRVFPAAPDHSLLLRKAINEAPHGGGQRMTRDSHEYRVLRRWIAQGMPYGSGDEPRVESIQIYPSDRRLSAAATQQLSVVARYTDGSLEDVTRAAVYESNDPQMGEVSESGLVALGEVVGDVAVMARYQGHVTVFRADIPLPPAPENADAEWPEPRNLVDEHVFAKLRSLRIPASPPCDDATFLRRVTLDIAGRLPTLDEVRTFEQDDGADKRDRLIDRLLASDDYAAYFANKWNAILRNRRSGGGLSFDTVAFHHWIEESFRINKPYDEFVREILTASGSVANNPAVAWFQRVPDTNQRLEDAAQLFLGQRIQCARCHHHPFEKWSQKDYAQMSAFFTLVSKKTEADQDEPRFVSRMGRATAKHPTSGEQLDPAGLDGETLQIPSRQDPRRHLVDWMVDADNPFFARAVVNRYWKHFMGRGLVEPEDDMRVTNPPSNPELLDGLADDFVASDYDLKGLVRLICRSRAYGLSEKPLERNLADRRSHSRFYPKRLKAEVLLDAVDQVTGSSTQYAGMPPGTRAVELPDTGFDSYFLTVFGRPRSATACECERSQEANLAQSLHLLNSEQIQSKLSHANGRAAALAADQERNSAEKIRELYRVALSRPPSPEELKTVIGFLRGNDHHRKAYEDVIWSLINSKEFMFNH